LYHSTLVSRVITKKREVDATVGFERYRGGLDEAGIGDGGDRVVGFHLASEFAILLMRERMSVTVTVRAPVCVRERMSVRVGERVRVSVGVSVTVRV